MKHILLFFLSLLITGVAFGKPQLQPLVMPDTIATVITFSLGDTSDSDLIPASGLCTISYIQEPASSDVVELYQVPSSGTAAASGVLVGTFNATTTEVTTVIPSQAGFKARATTATTGGSILKIQCSNTQLSGGTPDGSTFSAQTNDGAGGFTGIGPGNAGDVLLSSGSGSAMTMQEPAYSVVDSAVTGGARETNIMSNVAWNFIDPAVNAALIAGPCELANTCKIGVADSWPNLTSTIIDELIADTGWDAYSAGDASWSSILGSDDTIINGQQSTSIGCRHCKICAEGTSGHNSVGPGALNLICGEQQNSTIGGGTDNSIVGSRTITAGEDHISGGSGNTIDMRGVTVGPIGSNAIFAGINNLIDTTGTKGCENCSISGGKLNTIINNTVAQVMQHNIISGGTNNTVENRVGAGVLSGVTVGGFSGYGWLPNQRVNGAAPGYNSGDTQDGTLQEWTVLLRASPTGISPAAMTPGSSGSSPMVLVHAGVYTLDGVVSCQEQTVIATTLPTEYSRWTYRAVVLWDGTNQSTITLDDDSANGLTTAVMTIPADFHVGTDTTWVVQLRTKTFGFEITINPGADGTDLYCQGSLSVIQSRQNPA